MNMRRLSFVMMLVILTSACSMAGFGYDLMPRLMVKFADDYLYLSRRQEAEALERFKARHKLHAYDELPRYLKYLASVQQRLAEGFDAATLRATLDEGGALIDLGVERSLPAVAAMLADLDDDQIEYFGGRLKEKSDEYRERIRSGRSRDKDIADDIEDIAEWTGELDEKQQNLLRAYMKRMDDTRAGWLAWRIERNERLLKLLKESPGTEQVREFLHASWVKLYGIPEDLAASNKKNRSLSIEMMLALQETLSEEQREAVHEKLGEYHELIASIMPADVQVAVAE